MKHKILIADDEPRIIMLVEDFLSREYEIIKAENGKEALEQFERHKDVSLLILDIMMPYFDGLQVLTEIRKSSTVPVMMLTAKTTELDELTGFLSGADEYIKKPFSPSILRARVGAIIQRTFTPVSTSLGRRLAIDEQAAIVSVDGQAIDLSLTEYKLMVYFIENRNVVLKRDQLLDAVWGIDYVGTDRTVDTTINRLRIKLAGVSHYIETVRGLGYRFEVMDDE